MRAVITVLLILLSTCVFSQPYVPVSRDTLDQSGKFPVVLAKGEDRFGYYSILIVGYNVFHFFSGGTDKNTFECRRDADEYFDQAVELLTDELFKE